MNSPKSKVECPKSNRVSSVLATPGWKKDLKIVSVTSSLSAFEALIISAFFANSARGAL